MIRYIAVLTICGALFGCAAPATGRIYSDHAAAVEPPGSNAARIVLYRVGANEQYSGRDARLSVDGKTKGKVAYKGFAVVDIPAGSRTLAVDLPGDIGECVLTFPMGAGEHYYFEVTPRRANFLSGFLAGPIGAAIESAGKECGGAFAISQVSKAVALPALMQTRETAQ